MSNGSPDVVIVGAGVIGCSIALGLARRGVATLNVDALPAPGYGSTSHSSAIVRPYYSHVTSCAIAHEARSRWLDWRAYLDDAPGDMAEYRECGGLVLFREGDESSYSGNLKILDDVGVDYRLMNEEELVAHYPGICLDGFGPPRRMDQDGFGAPTGGRISGGILIPAAGYVSDPQLAARNLHDAAAAAGAQFRFGARIAAISRDSERVRGVELDTGETVAVPIVVNAAGPHSYVINELAGITEDLAITTRAHRHEVAYLRAPPGYVDNGNGFVVDLDAGVYQRADGVDLLIGSADPDCDPPDIVDPDDYNDAFTSQWTVQAYRAGQRFPGLEIENRARGTVGLYDVSDDWVPIYDKTDLGGYYLAIGTSGNQFKNAPIIGDLMAEIVCAVEAGRDHDVTPCRLALPCVGREVGLEFYSRNRVIGATRSVMA